MTSAALRFRVEGPRDAPAVVLSNSLGTSLEMWDPLVPALLGEYRVIRYDLRGHGGSAVPPGPYRVEDLGADLLALLDSLGIARAHVVGLSIGGLVSLWVAANAPERVDRAVVVSSAARFPNPERYRERAVAVRQGGVAPLAAAIVERWLTPDFAAAHASHVAWLREMVAAMPAEGYAGCCAVVAETDLRPALASIRSQLLVVAAADDLALPASYGEEIARFVPGAAFRIVDGAAHLASVERPDAIARLVLEHLAGGAAPDESVPASPEPSFEAGLAVRRAVLGDAHVDRALAAATAFDRPFQEFITRYAWGGTWAREGLDRRTRSCVTLAILVALRAENELPLHIRGALRNGLTAEEIRELIIHAAIYAGVPAANSAMTVARRILEEEAPPGGGE